jgi:ribonuclease HI
LRITQVKIFVDGSALPRNPGHGGAGVVVEYEAHVLTRAFYLGPCVTNQQAELGGIFFGFTIAKALGISELTIYSDSTYAIGIITKNWKAKKNRNLVYAIRNLWEQVQRPPVLWVKGHAGNQKQELSDRLATFAAKNQKSFTKLVNR